MGKGVFAIPFQRLVTQEKFGRNCRGSAHIRLQRVSVVLMCHETEIYYKKYLRIFRKILIFPLCTIHFKRALYYKPSSLSFFHFHHASPGEAKISQLPSTFSRRLTLESMGVLIPRVIKCLSEIIPNLPCLSTLIIRSRKMNYLYLQTKKKSKPSLPNI